MRVRRLREMGARCHIVLLAGLLGTASTAEATCMLFSEAELAVPLCAPPVVWKTWPASQRVRIAIRNGAYCCGHLGCFMEILVRDVKLFQPQIQVVGTFAEQPRDGCRQSHRVFEFDRLVVPGDYFVEYRDDIQGVNSFWFRVVADDGGVDSGVSDAQPEMSMKDGAASDGPRDFAEAEQGADAFPGDLVRDAAPDLGVRVEIGVADWSVSRDLAVRDMATRDATGAMRDIGAAGRDIGRSIDLRPPRDPSIDSFALPSDGAGADSATGLGIDLDRHAVPSLAGGGCACAIAHPVSPHPATLPLALILVAMWGRSRARRRVSER